jgi:NAD-dependent DNA ligase
MIVRMKEIHAFFEKIGAVGLGRGNVQRIMNAGFDTIAKIIAMKYEDFLTVEGFKEKMSLKASKGIINALNNIDLPSLMDATNIFGRGLGSKRIQIIMEAYPDILVHTESKTAKLEKIVELNGFKDKTANMFVDYIDKFNEFIQKSKLTHLYNQTSSEIDKENPFYGKKIVFTGCRDKKLENYLKGLGADLTTSVSKNTDIVVYKNKSGRKYEKARALSVTTFEFKDFQSWVMER